MILSSRILGLAILGTVIGCEGRSAAARPGREAAATENLAAPGPNAPAPERHGSAASEPSRVAAPAGSKAAGQEALTAVVYKDPNCGCCAKWIEHIRAAGFNPVIHDVNDINEAKRRNNIPRSLHSCHTAEIGGYAVEGHVPADLILKMLKERPNIAGLAVPGMPVGSPGMEGMYSEPYDVMAFSKSGSTSVYAKR